MLECLALKRRGILYLNVREKTSSIDRVLFPSTDDAMVVTLLQSGRIKKEARANEERRRGGKMQTNRGVEKC